MMVMIVMVTYNEIGDDGEDNDDSTGGTGTQGRDCNSKHFNSAYMMIWMMITVIDDDGDECVSVQPLQTIHFTGRLTSNNMIFRELYCRT